MDQLHTTLHTIRDSLWGAPTLCLLLGTGIYLTVILRGIQFRYLGYGIKQLFASEEKGEGDISNFEALMTSLAGAVGTGSIVGISTALAIGGVGSLFWMWVAGILGMATKYAESFLAIKFRKKDARGEMIGGPMGYMEKGLKKKWMAALFAFLGVFASTGTGNLVQVNAITEAIGTMWPVNPWMIGLATSGLTALIILGGIKSIGRFTGFLVPVMSLFYFVGGCIVILLHADQIPGALWTIVTSAFQGQSAVGGFLGAGVMSVVQMGASRAVLSTEAGLGISSIASAAAKTETPLQQATMTMTGSVLATLILCTITGLAIVVTGSLDSVNVSGKVGASLVMEVFQSTITGGQYLVSIGLILFAFSTVIAWAYYGEKCAEYLFGERAIFFFRLFFTLLVVLGAVIELDVAWTIADIANAIMIIPNLIALIGLSKILAQETAILTRDLSQSQNLKS